MRAVIWVSWSALLATGCALVATGCADEDRAGFLANPKSDVKFICDGGSCRPDPEGCGDGGCSAVSLPPVGAGEGTSREICLSEEQEEDFLDTPLTGSLDVFSTDDFDPRYLKDLRGTAQIKAESQVSGFIACAESSGSFELVGGATSVGPLLVIPDEPDDANFFPTVIQQAPRTDASIPAVPVFGKAEVENIFEQLDIEANPDRGHIVVEFVFVEDSERFRQAGIELRSLAGTVAYKDGAEWSRDLTATTSDGLAIVTNTGALGGLGGTADLRYVVLANDPDREIELSGITSLKGAVTYVALTPEGISVPGGS